MKFAWLFLTAIPLLSAAEDAWTKVKEIKSGTELRIFKTGAKQPILAKMDEATDDRLLVAGKNEQMAIEKSEIDRIDARPPQKGPRIVKETKVTSGVNQPGPGNEPTRVGNGAGPNQSTSSGVSIGGKPDFETVYRRTNFDQRK